MDVENKPKIGCVVMAAGNARRFGENKLAAQLRGRSLILRALEAVPAEKFDKVVVVRLQYAPGGHAAGREVPLRAIHNPHPDYGISHTIELGLTALRDCDGVLFQVSDQPLLRRESVAELVDRCTSPEDRRSGLRRRAGNPASSCPFFPGSAGRVEDHGNTVIRRHEADLLLLDVPAEELRDVDTAQACGGASGGQVLDPTVYEFDAVIRKVPDIDGAYVEFPMTYRRYSVRAESRWLPPLTASPTRGAWCGWALPATSWGCARTSGPKSGSSPETPSM